MTKDLIFRITVWFAAIYHILLGCIGLFGSAEFMTPIIRMIYGVTPVFDNQFTFLVKFISAYFIAFGLMMFVLGRDTYKYRVLTWVAVGLFLIRIFTAFYYFGDLQTAFNGMSIQHNFISLIPVMSITALLIIFRPREKKKKKN